ncbi:type II toxin-antitoxin system PemK/MazF family toxin [Allosphingosinicella sp.]|uniref:type II toxin-antitoxin system PemK/MazF family toxin n=1 Tax=Allosphingosinicella sp. TaxID=2823234 RepID=UPI00378464C5
MSDQETNHDEVEKSHFPSDEELLAAGYVSIDFGNMPEVSHRVTSVGHPFPQHHEIVAAGYVPISRRERRIISRPRVGQMYWIDFPHDAYAPEFVNEHPGIVIRAAKSLHDTCIILPVTSSEQKAGTHFHELSTNPNPKGEADGITAYVVCDHIYTVNINRLRPLVWEGKAIYPRVEQHDMDAIFGVLKQVLAGAFAPPPPAPAVAPVPARPARKAGPNTLSLRKKS